MKTLTLTIVSILNFSISHAAQIDNTFVSESTKRTLQQQESGDYLGAALTAATASLQIGKQIGVDSVVEKIQTSLRTQRQEIVTSREVKSFTLKDAFMQIKGTQYYDVAKIIVTNPEEVAMFDSKTQSDLQDLRSMLVNYVSQNQDNIALMKVFAVKSLEMASKLNYAERKQVENVIYTAWQKSQMLSFLGTQMVLRCTETNYANRKKGLELSALGLNFEGFYSDVRIDEAYSETQCGSPTSSTVEYTHVEKAYSTLLAIDLAGKRYALLLGRKDLSEAPEVLYPTWGSPVYNHR